MISYPLYKVLHIAGVLFVMIALGGLVAAGRDGDRRRAGLTHGIGLVVILVTGFGLLARLQAGFPPWVWGKLVIWLLIGGAIAAIRRRPELARLWWITLPLLGAVAGYLAIYKPGL